MLVKGAGETIFFAVVRSNKKDLSEKVDLIYLCVIICGYLLRIDGFGLLRINGFR